MKSRSSRTPKRKRIAKPKPLPLRIIGGEMGGRKILYSGDPQVRPMKDRTREAVFNLVGPSVKGKHAIDLFAGTGAMAIESISRGASSATLVERHIPSARLIRQNLASLQIEDQTCIIEADAFLWIQDQHDCLPNQPWLIFVCPPYRFFRERFVEMEQMIGWFVRHAPPGSLMIVEAEVPFDFEPLSHLGDWDARIYRPAVVGRLELGVEKSSGGSQLRNVD